MSGAGRPGPHLWSGRFDGGPDAGVFSFGVSLPFDRRLFEEDVEGSLAWAEALARAGVISQGDADAMAGGLQAILAAGRADAAFVSGPDEDIHAFVERQLVERIGEAGKRLHTGRSRNEQVSLDLRLYLKRRIPGIVARLKRLAGALASRAEACGGALMPSYTHLRRAQPILAAHFFLAHAAAFRRDAGRFERAADEADEMPLGSGAIAGATCAVDTAFLARRLGFSRVVSNSLDASSDRDFAAAFLFACSVAMVHLSRLAEDVILFTSEEFGFFDLPDRFATGSSLMPQKKNPDPLELARGKSGRVLGRLAGWLATMKGLPSGYNRDLQEDKEAVFEAEDTVSASLDASAAVVAGLELNAERTGRAASGLLLATDVADYLVARGVAFRDAHAIVGGMVRTLSAQGRDFASLGPDEWRAFSDRFEPDVAGAISAAASVAAKRTPQSTNPEAVRAALDELRAWLGGGR
ncbi:MAG TPA: argininosuccinate lyase [Vicinamibacterales bacterium]|nr:argininosuccinate lyase [Vicinamibacterales bacterium]HPW19291.1 argininosuccinate lyase [Vicinamibacterales bacterium]